MDEPTKAEQLRQAIKAALPEAAEQLVRLIDLVEAEAYQRGWDDSCEAERNYTPPGNDKLQDW